MISVCMATYNGERYIKEQLDSILCQLSDGDEVIISDDGSTDRTVEIIKSYRSDKITLLEGQSFRSPVYNFEHALKHANNDLIFLSDQDDIWEVEKVATMVNRLETCDLVLSDAQLVDGDGMALGSSFYALNSSSPGFLKNLVNNSYIGCTMAFNRKVLERALPFPRNTPMHDWWIGLVAEHFGKVCFCEAALVRYRRHGANTSASAETSPYTLKEKLRMRLVLLLNLFKRSFGK